jgi:hypothetical protein
MLIEKLLDIVLYLILRPAILALGLVHRHHAPPHPTLHILRPELDGVQLHVVISDLPVQVLCSNQLILQIL